jgi:hypothetical protein
MAMDHAPDLVHAQQTLRQQSFARRFDLAAVLAQLRRNPLEAELPIEARLIRRGKGSCALAHPLRPGQSIQARPVAFGAGSMHQGRAVALGRDPLHLHGKTVGQDGDRGLSLRRSYGLHQREREEPFAGSPGA